MYECLLADKPTGAQGLKVGTISNRYTYEMGPEHQLWFKEGNEKVQFGFIIAFQSRFNRKQIIYNINVHLNGGKTDKDKDIRDKQLEELHNQIE